MNKLNKAIILSAKIHSGKKGRNNEPAVLHSIRVMNQMKSNKGKIVGVLHDVVETEKISIDDLAAQGFGKSVCKTIEHSGKSSPGANLVNIETRLKKSLQHRMAVVTTTIPQSNPLETFANGLCLFLAQIKE